MPAAARPMGGVTAEALARMGFRHSWMAKPSPSWAAGLSAGRRVDGRAPETACCGRQSPPFRPQAGSANSDRLPLNQIA